MLGVTSTSSLTVYLAAVKGRQQAAWSNGDCAVVDTTVRVVRETLRETLDLRAGENVLDIAAGNGNATLAAARRARYTSAVDRDAQAADRRPANSNREVTL
jgi:precorrin-6B methylase 2